MLSEFLFRIYLFLQFPKGFFGLCDLLCTGFVHSKEVVIGKLTSDIILQKFVLLFLSQSNAIFLGFQLFCEIFIRD